MDHAHKTALKSGSIAGLIGAAVVAPIATPVVWAALAYGTYRFAKAAYQRARLKDAPQGQLNEDDLFF